MPRKIDLITELYKRTINDITSDSVAWRAFCTRQRISTNTRLQIKFLYTHRDRWRQPAPKRSCGTNTLDGG